MVENIVKYLNIFNLDTSKIFLFFYIFLQFLLIFVYKKSSEWCSFHREVLTQKKSVKFHTWGVGAGVRTKLAHFHTFFIFFLSCPKSCKSAKKIFCSRKGGGGYPLAWKSKFFDILGKNLVIFYRFSRFISEKNKFFLPKYVSVNVWKKKFLKFHTF